MKSQVVPLQLVALAPVGFRHDVHEAPHESTLVFDTHRPRQLCVADGQTPAHAAELRMHVPKHTFIPGEHAGWQSAPSQVTEPPIGCTQALHDDVPQLPTSVLLTQRAPHRCLASASCERKAFHRVIFKTGRSGSLGVGESFSLHASHQSPASSLFALPQTSQEYVSVHAILSP